MALFQVSITIWLLFILLNGALLLGANYGTTICAELSHVSCGWVNNFVAQGINATNLDANIQNGTFAGGFNDIDGTLVGNLTNPSNITFSNHTGDGSLLDPILDSADSLLFNAQEVGRVVTNACIICNTMDSIANVLGVDWPRGMAFMIISGMGVTNVILLLYLSSGRSI